MSRPNVVTAARATVAYTDTSSVSLGYLPAKAIGIRVSVFIGTAFDAGTTNVIDVGVAGTANNLANDVDVSSTGVGSVTLGAAAGVVQSTSDPQEITAIFVPSGSAATAGSAEVLVEYTFTE